MHDYYAVLGVRSDASFPEIRAAYRKLALKWHPDRLRKREPRLVAEANRRFQHILEAYQVLSDQNKRRFYDAGSYNSVADDGIEADEVEGFSDFLQEMLKLMADVRREGKQYSLSELQQMLAEMAQGFQNLDAASPAPRTQSQWRHQRGSAVGDFPTNPKRTRSDSDQMPRRRSGVHLSSVQVFGAYHHHQHYQ